jgi:hypothetical protein
LQRTVIGAAGGQPPDWLPIKDFYAWADVEEKPRPPSEAGAALAALVDRELHEDFWLDGPWFDDLMAQGEGKNPPSKLCLSSPAAILLAPYRVGHGQWGGFLIAKPEASGRSLEFTCLDLEGDAINAGHSMKLKIPAELVNPKGFGSSRAGAILQIV